MDNLDRADLAISVLNTGKANEELKAIAIKVLIDILQEENKKEEESEIGKGEEKE